MSNDYTLVTYTCLHFALIPSTSISNFDGVFEEFSEPSRAESDLQTKLMSCHLSVPTHCANFDCYHILQPEWEERITFALSSIQKNLRSFRRVFMQLGKVYHNIPLDTRVALSNKRICNLTHQQYGIEKRAWKEDPFFKPYLEARELVKAVKTLIRWSSWNDDTLAEVAKKINHCRAFVSKVTAFENEIVAGTRKLHQVYTDNVNEEMNAINAMNDRIAKEKAAKRKEKRAQALAAAELRKKEEEAAAAIKLAEEAERIAIQEAAAKKTSRRGFFDLLDRVKGKSRKPELRLAESPKPKEQQYIQHTPQATQAEPVHEVVEETAVVLSTTAVDKYKIRPRVPSRGPRSPEMSSSKVRRRKALLRDAIFANFQDRMNGF